MTTEKFWRKSYDANIKDLDPKLWETSFVDVVKPIFKKFPHKAAMVFMGVEISFAQLDRYSNQFANLLLANGLKKGDVVGINLPNIPEYVIAWLGALKAGCAVSGVSPLLSAEEMRFQLSDADAKVLVTLDAIFEKRLLGIAKNLAQLKLVVVCSVGGFLPAWKRTLGKWMGKIPQGRVSEIEGKKVVPFSDVIRANRFSSEPPKVQLTPDDLAYIQYTGGTTGSPKGAMLSHRNAVSDLVIVQHWLGWEQGEGIALSAFPLFHIAGLFFNENCVFLGWTEILIPNPRDTDHICKEIGRYHPTVLVNVPSLFQLLMQNKKFRALDHSNIKACISAASPFPEESQRELERIVGEGKLIEVYGMSETAPLTTMNPSRGKKKLGTIGLPLINTDLKLMDPETGKEAAIGEPGEICVKGPQVMSGYYHKPEETRLTIDKDGYLHTGDVAICDEDGYLRIVDRTKDMIIVSGYKVFSKKVEEILSEHPAIQMIATIGLPNPERPGSEIVKAFVVPKPNVEQDGNQEALRQEILRFAKEKLAPYEVPKVVEFRKELPLTTIGKVDKKNLRKEVRR